MIGTYEEGIMEGLNTAVNILRNIYDRAYMNGEPETTLRYLGEAIDTIVDQMDERRW